MFWSRKKTCDVIKPIVKLNKCIVRHVVAHLIVIVTHVAAGPGQALADYAFGTPTNLGPTVNSSSRESEPSVSADGLELFFTSNRPGGSGSYDIWAATRETVNHPWGEPVNLGPTVNGSGWDFGPSITANGELCFSSNRPGGYGGIDGWITTRASISEPWGTPVNLGPVLNGSSEDAVEISFDGLTAIISSMRSGGYGGQDLWISTRPTLSDVWSEPVNLGPEVNSGVWDWDTALSSDNRVLFFTSQRSGGLGGDNLLLTIRATTEDAWSTPINLGPMVNSTYHDSFPGISFDGSALYFCSNRPGGSGNVDLWQTSILPVVDFNGDGIVDSDDMSILVNHWGEDYSLCDIGPMPWGDGIVDVQDMIVLSKHLLPAFAAHWKLDETEGSFAYDSVGDHDSLLSGNPLWQSADGRVGGALQLDGVDDYVSTPSILDAAKRPLSVLAWVKGGEPGQVILSQTDGIGYGAAWLSAESSGGGFTTELMDPQPALKSEAVITDGAWHHIGLVWDGSLRCLYVDGAGVAEDAAALSNTINSDGGLHLGAGKTLDANSFFSGLIDDVRIYRRALSAGEISALAQ